MSLLGWPTNLHHGWTTQFAIRVDSSHFTVLGIQYLSPQGDIPIQRKSHLYCSWSKMPVLKMNGKWISSSGNVWYCGQTKSYWILYLLVITTYLDFPQCFIYIYIVHIKFKKNGIMHFSWIASNDSFKF